MSGWCLRKCFYRPGPALLAWAFYWFVTPAQAEPERFDWRLHASDLPAWEIPRAEADSPNPVVLPLPEADPRPRRSTGWRWLRPQLAKLPGSRSGPTAVRLATAEQEREMARQRAVLDGVLPETLSGLAPLAVESGIEWRF